MGVALLEGDYSSAKIKGKIYELKGSNQILMIIWNKFELIYFFLGSAII